MGRTRTVTLIGGSLATTLLLSGCIAPDIDVVGALGLTVTEDGRPVLVVEPCETEAALVDPSFDREGLAPDEENEQLAIWTAEPAAAGQTRIVLDDVGEPWKGPDISMEAGRGYVAGGSATVAMEGIPEADFPDRVCSR